MKVNKKILLISSILLVLIASTFGIYKYLKYKEYLKLSPYAVVISNIKPNSVTISWRTDEAVPTYIKFNSSDKQFGTEDKVIDHEITISGLKESSKYSFNITDGKEEWDRNISNKSSTDLDSVDLDIFEFTTSKTTEDILLPSTESIEELPNYKVYTVLEYEDNKSTLQTSKTNRYGGTVIDLNLFLDSNGNRFLDTYPEANLKILNTNIKDTNPFSLVNRVFASEINCNQSVGSQTSNAISREAFTDLATRWVNGRGKNYASECYNDVVKRAKAAGMDPAFALTIWLNESGASNYTQNSSLQGLIEDFGIHGQPTAPTQDFNAQITYFLKLKFNYSCPGLSYWEAWGNMYKWGSCNTDNPVRREQGIAYYEGINRVYGWVTNGKSLPSSVVGYTPSGEEEENESESGGWGNIDGPLCCALKLDNKQDLKGDFENNSEGKTCSDIWQVGRSVYGGKIEYSVEVEGKVGDACQVDYPGVCCVLTDSVRWYPQQSCNNKATGISTYTQCMEYANNKGCFFRDGKYKWLPKAIGTDFVVDITSESVCNAKNSSSEYSIQLKKGVNFVGLDFTPIYQNRDYNASDLVSSYSNILLIGKFEEYSWSNLVSRSDNLPYSGTDFVLTQNNGYLVITDQDIKITLDGWKDRDAQYSEVKEGWNLVGGSIYTSNSSASRLINSLNQKGINIESIAKWNLETGHFDYRVEKDEKYGEDFRLINNEAVFIRSR